MLDADLATLYEVGTRVPGCQTEYGSLSGGFHVPAQQGGVRALEITNCDLKLGLPL